MPWTIPPDSLSLADRPTNGRTSEVVARATLKKLGEEECDLVAAAQAYLACLASSRTPEPALTTAWAEFYRTYHPVIVRVVRSRRGMANDQDDGSQDVWQAVVTRLASFQPDPSQGTFRDWLFVVARRRLSDRSRNEARTRRPTSSIESLDHLEGSEEDPAVGCERNDERAFATRLLVTLRGQVSPLSYRVFHLRSLEEVAVIEVAHLVGLTADQVRARHHRTLARLRRLAEPAGSDISSRETNGKSRNFSAAAQQRTIAERVLS